MGVVPQKLLLPPTTPGGDLRNLEGRTAHRGPPELVVEFSIEQEKIPCQGEFKEAEDKLAVSSKLNPPSIKKIFNSFETLCMRDRRIESLYINTGKPCHWFDGDSLKSL